MRQPIIKQIGVIEETVRGVVDRVTYHNSDNGFSILRVFPFNSPQQMETVVVHQTKVFAGATMEFNGAWTVHPQYGRQFQANKAVERKPATSAALEKYLGSGLIKGVGPKTAKSIVGHFGDGARVLQCNTGLAGRGFVDAAAARQQCAGIAVGFETPWSRARWGTANNMKAAFAADHGL